MVERRTLLLDGHETEAFVKSVSTSASRSPDALHALENERLVLESLRGVLGVPQLWGTLGDGAKLALLLEPWEGWSLAEVQRRGEPLPARAAAELLLGVAEILADLSWHGGIVHGGVQPERIILNEQGGVTLVDFTNARAPALPGWECPPISTDWERLEYLAPEALTNVYEARSDIYSLGAAIEHSLPAGAPDELRTLVRKLQDYDPDARPDASSLVEKAKLLVDAAEGPGLRELFAAWRAPEAPRDEPVTAPLSPPGTPPTAPVPIPPPPGAEATTGSERSWYPSGPAGWTAPQPPPAPPARPSPGPEPAPERPWRSPWFWVAVAMTCAGTVIAGLDVVRALGHAPPEPGSDEHAATVTEEPAVPQTVLLCLKPSSSEGDLRVTAGGRTATVPVHGCARFDALAPGPHDLELVRAACPDSVSPSTIGCAPIPARVEVPRVDGPLVVVWVPDVAPSPAASMLPPPATTPDNRSEGERARGPSLPASKVAGASLPVRRARPTPPPPPPKPATASPLCPDWNVTPTGCNAPPTDGRGSAP